MPVDKNGKWNFQDSNGTIYYKRTYRGNHDGNRYKFYKKYSKHIVRRYKEQFSNGSMYKKCFDYWFTVD